MGRKVCLPTNLPEKSTQNVGKYTLHTGKLTWIEPQSHGSVLLVQMIGSGFWIVGDF